MLLYFLIVLLRGCTSSGRIFTAEARDTITRDPNAFILSEVGSGVKAFVETFLDSTAPQSCLLPFSSSSISWIIEQKHACSSGKDTAAVSRISVKTIREFINEDLGSIGESKVIVLLREPVQRLAAVYSERLSACREGACNLPPFREYFADSAKHDYEGGMYLESIAQLKTIDPSNVFIVNYDSLIDNPESLYNFAAKHLQLPALSSLKLRPAEEETSNFRLSCVDYKHFKCRYDYYNSGLVSGINWRPAARDHPPLEPFVDRFEDSCGGYKLSDFNSSFVGPPHIMLIGMQKAGTTSLHDFLIDDGQDTLAYTKKEPRFFDRNFDDEHFNSYIEGYLRVLQMPSQRAIDSTPQYSVQPLALSHMTELYDRDHLRQKLFILLLREPVSRLFSWYKHTYGECAQFFQHGHEIGFEDLCNPRAHHHSEYSDSFHDFLHRKKLLTPGFYKEHIQRWLDVIPRKSLFILNVETLFENKDDAINRLRLFLGKGTGSSNLKLPDKNTALDHCKGCNSEDIYITCDDHNFISAIYAEKNKGL